jgi:uncharacterized protein (DUF433 family)
MIIRQLHAHLASQKPVENILQDYPQLERADILACFAYAAVNNARSLCSIPL